MRIMHLITGLGIGGAEMMLFRFVAAEESKRHDTSVVSLRGLDYIGEKILDLGVPVFALDMKPSGMDPMAIARLRRHIQHVRPDIIQTWMYHADLVGGLMGKSLGIPVVWGIHNELLHPDEPSPTVGFVKHVCSRLSTTLPDAIVSCSESAARYHTDWGYDSSRMSIIPNGFDLTFLTPERGARESVRKELGIPRDADIIIHVARMNPVKNHRGVLESAALLHERRPDVHFLMAGFGVEPDHEIFRPWLEGKILGENLHVLGPRTDIHRLQAAADIATLPSYSEAFPMAIGEAMALGTPCVVTDVGDLALMAGDSGIVVPAGDPVAVADAWEALLREGPVERKARAIAARKHIEEKFSISGVVNRYLSVYHDVLARRGTTAISSPSNIERAPDIRMIQRPEPVRVPTTHPAAGRGALVISLDFELLWGMQDLLPDDGGAYRDNLLGARSAIPAMLELFAEFDIAATWATVGMLFAENREELEAWFPAAAPAYEDPRLSTRGYPFGNDERDDPLHFASSIIRRIQEYPGQEIGTHTFSHYYCLEPGQTAPDFAADMQAAVGIAAARGVSLESIVFPRNQHNPAYDTILLDAGITTYRGNRAFWPDHPVDQTRYFHPARRVGRIADVYLPVARQNSTAWSDVITECGLGNVPAHRLMVPRQARLEPVRLKRVIHEMTDAAASGRIYHIWWHPHNFGVNQEENLGNLRSVFQAFADCRARYGMTSLTMAETTRIARSIQELQPSLSAIPPAGERRVS